LSRDAKELLRRELSERGMLFDGMDFQGRECALKLSADGSADGKSAEMQGELLAPRRALILLIEFFCQKY